MNFTAGTRLAMRQIIAKAVAGRAKIDPLEYAAERWRGDAPITTRSAIGGATSLDWSVTADAALLFDAVLEASVAGRARLRQVPTNVRLLRPNDQARGYWVGQGKAIPLSKSSVLGSALEPRKIGAIVVTTGESLETQDSRVERALEADFRRAVTSALDEAFLDPGNAGIAGEMPAAVTNGVTAIAGSGDPTADLAALVAAFQGDLSQAVFATDPVTAAQIALWRDTSGGVSFPDCGPAGGSLLGLPLLTSRASPRDTSGGSIALIDGSGIAAGFDGMEVSLTREATLEMDDTPTGASYTPVAASATLVNLWQNELVGFKVILHANWERQRTGCVAVVTGAAY